MAAWGAAAAGAAAQQQDIPIQVPQGSDSIQCIAFSPVPGPTMLLAAGSWDNAVRCWMVASTGQSQPKLEVKVGAPVLDVTFAPDGSKIFAASCDKSAHMIDVATQQSSVVGMHDAPVKAVRFLPTLNMLMTGSWDKTIRLWDCRQPQPVGQFNLQERCYAMDAKNTLAVAATANRMITIYDLAQRKEFKTVQSVLKMQTRCIACFNGADGFAIGSIEGRVGIQYVDAARAHENFSFKCHRDQNNVHCVNSLAFHPRFGTFATTGSDGRYVFWDKDKRNRLKIFNPVGAPVTCSAFSPDGTLFAYGASYDWHQGHQGHNPGLPNRIMIHITPDADIQPKAAPAGGRR